MASSAGHHQKPVLLLRSTFLGSGAWVAHWGGDNAATWNDLRWSLSTVKLSGFHGMPMIGVVSLFCEPAPALLTLFMHENQSRAAITRGQGVAVRCTAGHDPRQSDPFDEKILQVLAVW